MNMSVDKNVEGFHRENYVPTEGQYVVKYLKGRGNNLHEVELHDGSTEVVSMPSRFSPVWLKKNDCLVIDPTRERNNVQGEIFCALPLHHVRQLIQHNHWGSSNRESLLMFFNHQPTSIPTDGCIPTANSSSDEENNNVLDQHTREKNRSRVQLVTSGTVTVTNVLSHDDDAGIQSLEFEADEEEDDSDVVAIQKHANTIRIQVNYDQDGG